MDVRHRAPATTVGFAVPNRATKSQRARSGQTLLDPRRGKADSAIGGDDVSCGPAAMRVVTQRVHVRVLSLNGLGEGTDNTRSMGAFSPTGRTVRSVSMFVCVVVGALLYFCIVCNCVGHGCGFLVVGRGGFVVMVPILSWWGCLGCGVVVWWFVLFGCGCNRVVW